MTLKKKKASSLFQYKQTPALTLSLSPLPHWAGQLDRLLGMNGKTLQRGWVLMCALKEAREGNQRIADEIKFQTAWT